MASKVAHLLQSYSCVRVLSSTALRSSPFEGPPQPSGLAPWQQPNVLKVSLEEHVKLTVCFTYLAYDAQGAGPVHGGDAP